VRERGTREQLEGRIVVDVAVLEHPAVAVIGVLAHADIGDHDQIRDFFLECTHTRLNGALVVPR
jgi:hypothetical protein